MSHLYAVRDLTCAHKSYASRPGSAGKVMAFTRREDAVQATLFLSRQPTNHERRLAVRRIKQDGIARVASATISIETCSWRDGAHVVRAKSYVPHDVCNVRRVRMRLERDFEF